MQTKNKKRSTETVSENDTDVRERWLVFALVAEDERVSRGTLCWLVDADPDQGTSRVRIVYQDAHGTYRQINMSPRKLTCWGIGSGMPDIVSGECKRWWSKEQQENAWQFANRMADLRERKIALHRKKSEPKRYWRQVMDVAGDAHGGRGNENPEWVD